MRKDNRKKIPVWGPYSKKYMGLSRIMRESRIEGARLDLVIYPTYAYSSVPVPNVTVPSAYHPWQCDTEGKYYQYRYELIWKDQLYADVSLYEIDQDTWGVRVEYCNNTKRIQECMLNLFVAVEYPQVEIIRPLLPEKSDHWKALTYEKYSFAEKRPWEQLNFDGMHSGEIFFPAFTEGKALAETFYALMHDPGNPKMFGNRKGDMVSYRKKLLNCYEEPILTIRYATYDAEESLYFKSNFGTVVFPPSVTPTTITVTLRKKLTDEFYFEMISEGSKKNGLLLDCLSITEKEDVKKIEFKTEKRNTKPKIYCEKGKVKYQYQYGEPIVYLDILDTPVRKRNLESGCIEDAPITRLTNTDATYDNLTRSFSSSFSEKHSDQGYYHVNMAGPELIQAKDRRIMYAVIGTKDKDFTSDELEVKWKERYESSCKEDSKANREGEPYRFSTNLMKSALFFNAVYPIYRHGDSIVHYTPGKRWDSLYTWDSGFIGMGMLEYSKGRAEYILDTYLSEEDNTDFPFLAHGSLVPTQFYLWYDLMMRETKERRRELKKYYPMLRRYYRFMAGKTEGSVIFRLKSNMPTVYDYFYNASGMDDYPPQVEMHRRGLSKRIAPVCSSAHFTRIAKIMSYTAEYYGIKEDQCEYQEDIRRVTTALLEYSWDEESGYFGYVLHDEKGMPKEIFCTENGENLNKGIDGVTPLIAGVWKDGQLERMISHLKKKGELWSEKGISTVDQSAGYYNDNGYWNGSVWFPYQYLLWRSMLDIGESDFAFRISETALRTWKQEVDFSYHTVELVKIRSGQGGWFHQFGGLSAPIVIWYHAYYIKGTVTAGYDTWIEKKQMAENFTSACISFYNHRRGKHIILVVMDSAYEYDAEINGKRVEYQEHVKGALEFEVYETQGDIIIKSQ